MGRTELCHEVRNPGPQEPQVICDENHHLALFDCFFHARSKLGLQVLLDIEIQHGSAIWTIQWVVGLPGTTISWGVGLALTLSRSCEDLLLLNLPETQMARVSRPFWTMRAQRVCSRIAAHGQHRRHMDNTRWTSSKRSSR